MALSNAERQRRHRERLKEKLAAAEQPVHDGEKVTASEIEAMKRKLREAEDKIAEKEGQRAAQETRANIAARQVDDATNRAMFAEADKERLAEQLAALQEELEELRNESATAKEWHDLLMGHYYGTAKVWLKVLGVDSNNLSHRDNDAIEAHNAFMNENITALDTLEMMEYIAFQRLNQLFSPTAYQRPVDVTDAPKWKKHVEDIRKRVT